MTPVGGSLSTRVLTAVARPATEDHFALLEALSRVLRPVGFDVGSAGGDVDVVGADPIVPSILRIAGAAGIALLAKSIAVAAIHRDRGGPSQDVGIDLRAAPHRLCPFYDQRWELLNGFPGGSPANVSDAFGLRFYRTRDERWVMPLNPYPKIKARAQELLGVPEAPEAVARAIARRDADELEAAGVESGVVMPRVRTVAELLSERHFAEVLETMPLIEVERFADGPVVPLSPGIDLPLDGVRALGMGHVIAGAGCGRALALHGADVLNVWPPNSLEHDLAYNSANVGLRSTTIDAVATGGRLQMLRLLSQADVFFSNRRPGRLAALGLTAHECAAVRPGIIHATVSLNGERGPWSDRVGFDQTAGCLAGTMMLEGGGRPMLPPILVVNDYITAWLLTVGIASALRRRSIEGGSYRVHVSLTRVALWMLELGIFEAEYAHTTAGTAGPHEYRDPEVFRARTPLGSYQGVTDQVRMSRTPGRYRTVLDPRGSSRPEWLPRR